MTQLSESPAVVSPKAVVQRYLDAVAAGDLETIADSFTDDATWSIKTDLPVAGPWEGRKAIVEDFLGMMWTRFEPGSISFDSGPLIAEGNTVVHEWTAHARSASGERYDNPCCGVFEVQDNRIAAVREYFDSRHVAQVLFPDQG